MYTPRATPSKRGRLALILVVDDEPDLLGLLVDQVSSLGYDVVAARDGGEGLRIAQDRPPDVILTDVIMPYMDGLEMLERLRGRPETRDIPVIALTALTDRRTRSRLSALGVKSFLAKPYAMRELAQRIREAILPGSWGDPLSEAGPRSPSLPPRTRR
jgi:two-component system, OmpR family, phosphate regulon response regulator PhoB